MNRIWTNRARSGGGEIRQQSMWAFGSMAAVLIYLVLMFPNPVVGQVQARPRLSLFHGRQDPESPSTTIAKFSKRIDCVAEEMRDDGLVILKQPDVYSQARMTKYRREFETEMVGELKKFDFILNARTSRLDAAAVDSQSSLAAALAPPGATSAVTATAPTTEAPPVAPSLQLSTQGPRFLSATALTVGKGTGNLGLEPTVYLDQKKRYLDHLAEIRRVNLGDDIADSAGYGLYLVRMPLSITPGECTVAGYGAEVSITAKHIFPADFLPATFRNLVINDLVDQLAPYLYERVRAEADRKIAQESVLAERGRLRIQLEGLQDIIRNRMIQTSDAINDPANTKRLLAFFLPNPIDQLQPEVADRLRMLQDGAERGVSQSMGVSLDDPSLAALKIQFVELDGWINDIKQGRPLNPANDSQIRRYVQLRFRNWMTQFVRSGAENIPGLIAGLASFYDAATPEDVDRLDAFLDIQGQKANTLDYVIASQRVRTARLASRPLPSSRIAKRSYPIAPREMELFFLKKNLDALATDAATISVPERPRATDIRSYIRQQLSVAYDLMSNVHPEMPTPPLDDPFGQIDPITRLVIHRAFYVGNKTGSTGGARNLEEAYNTLMGVLPDNLPGTPLGALCWAIAVDAGLLDVELRHQVKVANQSHGAPCPDLDAIRFYCPTPDAAHAFEEYVRLRWPVVVFALDPVTDAQNILDSFALRRKIEQDAETVALNRTVTAFTHGNETFGWRLYPRYQTPPSQSNFATLASTFVNGGPGPNYGLRKSKIEPGQRELAAVIVLPSFLPTVRVEASGNWFRLDDPEHLKVHTGRMMELGRRVYELRQELGTLRDAHCYRPTDVAFLAAKIDQVEAMLPIQSRLVPLPFDNTANGFDLFTEGTTALVPELSGFEGADRIVKKVPTSLILYGKNFSIHETRVVSGGKYLNPDSQVEILSREVARVELPGDVQPTFTYQGQPYVELYLATSTGISNRLLIPITDEGAQGSSPPRPEEYPSGSKVTKTNATSTSVEFEVPVPQTPATSDPKVNTPTVPPATPAPAKDDVPKSVPEGSKASDGPPPAESKPSPKPAVDPATATDPAPPPPSPTSAQPGDSASRPGFERDLPAVRPARAAMDVNRPRPKARPMILPPPPESDLPPIPPGEQLEATPRGEDRNAIPLDLPPLPPGAR